MKCELGAGGGGVSTVVVFSMKQNGGTGNGKNHDETQEEICHITKQEGGRDGVVGIGHPCLKFAMYM